MSPLVLGAVLVAAALLTSTVSGVVGMAGGAMLLGAMVALGLDPLVAIPMHAAVQLVSNTTRAFAHREHIRWRPFLIHSAIALPCPLIGLWLLGELDQDQVRVGMGLIILYAAWAPRWGLKSIPNDAAFGLAGLLAGSLGVVVGATGPLHAPFYLDRGFGKREIISTKATCQAYIHVIKIAAFAGLYPAFVARPMDLGAFTDHWGVVSLMAAATIGGTYAGRWLLERISEVRFVILYKLVLTALAIRLIWQSV